MWITLAGCAKSDSAAIATSEIVASYEVRGESGRLQCIATFQVGGVFGTYLELSGDDRVYCGDGARRVPLRKVVSPLNTVHYEGGEELAYQVGHKYTLELERGRQTLTSEATLPAEMNLTAPTPRASHEKGDPLKVEWLSASGSEVQVRLAWKRDSRSGAASHQGADDGQHIFTRSETETDGAFGDVEAELEVSRVLAGSLDPKFKNGQIVGKQRARVSFTLID